MDQLRVFLSLIWWYGGVVLSEIGNDVFIQLAYTLGPALSMAVAVFSGWLWARVGYGLLRAQQQKRAIGLSLLIIVPLLLLKGWDSVAELRASLSDPHYYELKGVGPVDQLALIAQAAGILLAAAGRWRGLQRPGKLPAEVLPTSD